MENLAAAAEKSANNTQNKEANASKEKYICAHWGYSSNTPLGYHYRWNKRCREMNNIDKTASKKKSPKKSNTCLGCGFSTNSSLHYHFRKKSIAKLHMKL